jgi:hypothetical protein
MNSALRSARLPVNLISSPINYANRLIGSPITSQSTGHEPMYHDTQFHQLGTKAKQMLNRAAKTAKTEQTS